MSNDAAHVIGCGRPPVWLGGGDVRWRAGAARPGNFPRNG
jgi:hypothetical protein